MKHDRRFLISLMLTILISSILCIGLYHLNNKYTYSELQPDHGQITFSQTDLNSLHFLIEDWECYPDLLLSPEDLSSTVRTPYLFYTDIGDNTRFDNGISDTDPHGCASYALHIWLPPTLQSYTLELPEIYSAYRLYINGQEYTRTGDPSPDSYQAYTQTKPITFLAKDRADILITVSDYSHFYSGMVYPPAFGLTGTVTAAREFRLLLSVCVIVFFFILFVLTAYLGFALHKKNAALFCILSLDACCVLGFPVLHALFELPVSGWYALELFCIYLMTVLVLVLHNRICNLNRLCDISVGIAICFCILALCYGLFSSSLSVPVMQLFSLALSVYKLCVTLYLLLTAAGSLFLNKLQSKALLCATAAYAVCFFWDRILPSYEPIILGWFSDLGNFFMITAIDWYILQEITVVYLRSLSIREQNRQITRQLVMQQEYSRQLSEHMEKKRRMIHDFRQHLRTIRGLAEKLDQTPCSSELLSYVDGLTAETLSDSSEHLTPFSDNPSVDALLQYYDTLSRKHQIKTTFQLIPLCGSLSDLELCTMLGNLLENAVDACQRLPENTDRFIRIHSLETDHTLFIRIENTYDGIFYTDPKTEMFLSRKNKDIRHGIGLESVRETVESCGGTIDIYPKEKHFSVGITLPLEK